MGLCHSRVWDSLFTKEPFNVVMVGLNAVGKTTIWYKLKFGEVIASIPTVGVNTETIHYKHNHFIFYDVGGGHGIRPLWRYHFEKADAVIFVLDTNDIQRLEEAKDELHDHVMYCDEVQEIPVLVFANKQDLPDALPEAEIGKALKLDRFPRQSWFIQACSAVTGDGLNEGLDWLTKEIIFRKNLKKVSDN